MTAENQTDKADRWRKKAEELRTWAEEFKDRQTREQLLECATLYDRMADGADRRGQ